jgi:hypothetical protein
MTLKMSLMAAAVAGLGLLSTSGAYADDATPGKRQMCVRLIDIDSTPVIDDSTILIKMKAKGQFKRIDLVGRCPGLYMANGFSHSTSTDDLCTTDPLHVHEAVGATCMIKQIVDITPDEAKQLDHNRGNKKPAADNNPPASQRE